MVLVERTSDNLRNGRRSRGPSPNGHASETTTTSGEEGDGLPEEKIRVGRDYQAVVPEFIPNAARRPNENNDRALLVWSPSVNIPDTNLDEYISLAKEKYGYNGEQALGMLFWHKHDLERAIRDLANFTPFPDDWTIEDKVLFEQAFQFHGKSFHRIRQMLPDKPISLLVKYYYSWKKTRTRTSLMDRQARKLASQRDEGSEGGSEHGSNTDSDSEEKVKLAGEKTKTSSEDNSNETKEGMAKSASTDQSSNKSCPADGYLDNANSKTLSVNAEGKSNVEINLVKSNGRKRPHSPITTAEASFEVKLSPNKRRLLSMSSPKAAKISRSSVRKSDTNIKSNIDEVTKHESVSKIDEMCNSNNVSDNIKPMIQIATLV